MFLAPYPQHMTLHGFRKHWNLCLNDLYSVHLLFLKDYVQPWQHKWNKTAHRQLCVFQSYVAMCTCFYYLSLSKSCVVNKLRKHLFSMLYHLYNQLKIFSSYRFCEGGYISLALGHLLTTTNFSTYLSALAAAKCVKCLKTTLHLSSSLLAVSIHSIYNKWLKCPLVMIIITSVY